MDYAVTLESVSKKFGDVWAVRDLSLRIGYGRVYGLLGPNGSGKSTTMKMILGLVKPDSGKILVDGIDVSKDPVEVRKIIGYVPETSRLYDYLTGIEYLDFIGEAYGMSPEERKRRIEEFLEAFELKGRENELISGYSKGMKQKIALIAALIHKPRILILDEPLSGLDPRSARIVKDLIHELAEEGVTTIFSTHILEIADAVCDELAIMYEGRKIAEGKPDELKQMAGESGSTLEEVFLKLTGAEGVREIVEALVD
ncbi:ABC transporter ATP-binding protein [Thermococci archaeon]|nr:MAG: ABC transporter ATP-binding protein [Thermococci archaeon]